MSIIVRRNPFDPRQRDIVEIDGPESLHDLARRHGIDPGVQPVVASVNGRYVLQRDWMTRRVDCTDLVAFDALPAGSGRSGGGSKNTLGLVLSIAVSVLAVAVGGPIAGALGFTAGTFGFTAASGAISAAFAIGGSVLINTIVPPQAAATLGGERASLAAPSPVYNLSARGNQARLGGVIPVVYGRHIIYPSFAATPYSTYSLNWQYLYLTLVVGQGHYDIEEINIGSSPISSFAEVDYEIVEPGEAVTLFDPNCYSAPEVTGQQMRATNEVGHDWIGPFTAAPPDTETNLIQVDMLFPRGVYAADELGNITALTLQWTVEARVIDDNGVPAGPYFVLAYDFYTGATLAPLRISNTWAPPTNARHQVRVQRTDAKSTNARDAHEIAWAGLKSFVEGPSTFGDVTVIAVKARATDNLNSRTAALFNVVATRKLPTWNGATWSDPIATRSIAWAIADVVRNATYGAGLPDTRLDLDALLALDDVWALRGDTFDAVVDQPSTIWEALTRIARTGRASPYYQAGMIRFHRDAEQTLPVAMYTAANIVLDSVGLDFVLPAPGQAADGVIGEYMDQRTWLPATVTSGVSGGEATNPAREQLFGIVDADQAARETAYMAHANRYRRAFVTFRTELDGMIPSVGDLIIIAHDLPRWGVSGAITGWDAATLIMTLDQEIDLDPDQVNTVRVRSATGAPSLSVLIAPGPSRNQILLAEVPATSSGAPMAIVLGGRQESTHYAIGRADQTPRQAIVSSIIPRGTTVEIRAAIEDVRVHAN